MASKENETIVNVKNEKHNTSNKEFHSTGLTSEERISELEVRLIEATPTESQRE